MPLRMQISALEKATRSTAVGVMICDLTPGTSVNARPLKRPMVFGLGVKIVALTAALGSPEAMSSGLAPSPSQAPYGAFRRRSTALPRATAVRYFRLAGRGVGTIDRSSLPFWQAPYPTFKLAAITRLLPTSPKRGAAF